MKCTLILLALAAAFTIAASPTVRRAIFYRDEPATPPGWSPTYRYFNGGQLIYTSDPSLYDPKEAW